MQRGPKRLFMNRYITHSFTALCLAYKVVFSEQIITLIPLWPKPVDPILVPIKDDQASEGVKLCS